MPGEEGVGGEEVPGGEGVEEWGGEEVPGGEGVEEWWGGEEVPGGEGLEEWGGEEDDLLWANLPVRNLLVGVRAAEVE